jgi:Golgi nucleoside diphosphatase
MVIVSLPGIFLSRVLTFTGTFLIGSDEGVYAWIAANYALGTLGGDPHKTIGIIELGGASAQVL